MTPDLWRQVETLFVEANELPPEERKAFLERSCPDSHIRREVESLLGYAEPAAAGRLQHLVDDVAGMLPQQPEPSRNLIDRMLGPYRIVSLIGQGGMGEIYSAEDPRLGRQVALKILPLQFTENSERVRRLQREARSASALNHPNIVTVFDFGQAGGIYYIATELIQGRTLRQILTQEPIPIREVLSIAMQMAAALAAAHAAGIVHRDIKPENVMVRPDGYVKVLDFGLAKLRESDSSGHSSLTRTRPGVVMGTVQYMSPEQARGLDADARSDLFSVGVVLYEMVSRRPPFQGRTGTDILAAIIQEDPPPLASLNPLVTEQLESVIRKCLRKDREERYQTSQDLQADLRLLRRELDTRASSASTPARLTATQATAAKGVLRRWPMAIAVLVILLAAAYAAYRLFPFNRHAWFQDVQMNKIRAAKGANSGTISPNGRYIAYMSFFPNGQRDLSVRLLTAPSSVQVQPPAFVSYYGVSFSPDETFLYYLVHKLDGSSPDTLCRIPVLGGTPQRLVEQATSTAFFSPDASRILFSQRQPKGGDALVTANPDGSDQRLLAQSPAEFAFGGADWSRDGKDLYYAEGTRNDQGLDWRIFSVPANGGTPRSLADFGRARIWQLKELPDRSGFIANAMDMESNLPQIWCISKRGAMRRVTHDLNEYQGLSSTRDGTEILTNAVERESEIWVGDPGHMDAARTITQPHQRFDQPVWAHDGHIVAALALSGASDLWVMNPDGSGQRQLVQHTARDYSPRACPDRDDVVFTSKKDGAFTVWRVRTDGSEVTQLTFGYNDQFPQCLAGGWVMYRSQAGNRFETRKVPILGGDPVPVQGLSAFDTISRDGKLMLRQVTDPVTHAKRTELRTVEGGVTQTSFPYGDISLEAWSPDGRGFAYSHRRSGAPEVWYQSLAGGPPRQLTHFGGDDIFWIDWSPDGRSLSCGRGRFIFDMVFIKDTP